jgi:hypothetical protein
MALAQWYGKAFCNILGGETAAEARGCDWLSNDIRALLCTSLYIPNKDTHEFHADITNEVVGAGYTAGGAALASKTLVYDAANDRVTLDAADVTWANLLTFRYAVLYNNTPALSADKNLLGYVDFITDQLALTLQWDPAGIFRIAV